LEITIKIISLTENSDQSSGIKRILKDMIDLLQENDFTNISKEWSISFLNLSSDYMKDNNEQTKEAINLNVEPILLKLIESYKNEEGIKKLASSCIGHIRKYYDKKTKYLDNLELICSEDTKVKEYAESLLTFSPHTGLTIKRQISDDSVEQKPIKSEEEILYKVDDFKNHKDLGFDNKLFTFVGYFIGHEAIQGKQDHTKDKTFNWLYVIGSEDSEKDRKELHKLFKANQNDTGQVKEKVLRLTVWVGLSEQSFKPNDKIQIKSIKKAEIFQKTMLQGQVNHIKDIKRLN